MYTAEIRDEFGQVESAATRETVHGIASWCFDHNIKLSDCTMTQLPDGPVIASYTFRRAPIDQHLPPEVVQYSRDLCILNTEILPGGLKCKYLLALRDHTGRYIAHSWKRIKPESIPPDYVLIQF